MITDTKSIKFMISSSKGKIYAHKAIGMILNSKSDYFINVFDMGLSVGCILCTAGSDNRCSE
ncbi:hypothetical protein CXF72_06990 [Psychromonas sp. MB-3u-54]|nr:hypothetical protein CXF72_06990 [Psychromonas sp. MB-3u-54]